MASTTYTSGFGQRALPFIPSYCKPFFCSCQEKFYKNKAFFEKNFARIQKKTEKTAHQLPKIGKNTPQGPAERHFPHNDAKRQNGGVA